MSTKVDIKLEGFKELTEQLEMLYGTNGPGGIRALTKAGREALKPVLAEAKRMVPHRTGILRDSLRIAARKSNEHSASVGLKVGKMKVENEIPVYDSEGALQSFDVETVRHNAKWRWHFIEIGTAHSAPHPYLRPAFNQQTDRMLQLMKSSLKEHIEKTTKKFAKAGLMVGPGAGI